MLTKKDSATLSYKAKCLSDECTDSPSPWTHQYDSQLNAPLFGTQILQRVSPR